LKIGTRSNESQLDLPILEFKDCFDKNITSDEYIEKIWVILEGISVILTHAEKEKDAETVGIVDEIEGSGKVRNCPVVI